MSPRSNRPWIGPEINQQHHAVKILSKELNLSPLTAQLLVGRNISTPETAYNFLHPGISQLHNPFLMKDMNKAVDRVIQALNNREKIMIFGDSDTDGTCGTVILFEYLKQASTRVCYLIPSTNTDGYSLNDKAVQFILESHIDLVITVDNGSCSLDGAKVLKHQGVDVVITDHHVMGDQQPDVAALLNPQRPDCVYPYRMLSGTGVAFKFLSALDEELKKREYWQIRQQSPVPLESFYDLVALATVADRSPLNGENRSLVKLGLEKINLGSRPGITALIHACKIRSYITPSVISHRIAPKINAAGRLNQPVIAARLMLSKSHTEVYKLSAKLVELNRERQKLEKTSFTQAVQCAQEQENDPAIVQISEDFHPGTLGIVASKISRMFNKPTILLSQTGSMGFGSARCEEQVNLLDALKDCDGYLEDYGGHNFAAGLSMDADNFDSFKEKMLDSIGRSLRKIKSGRNLPDDPIHFEAELKPEDLTHELADELMKMSPFGYHNPEPVLTMRNVNPELPRIFSKKHIKFELKNESDQWEIYAWDHADWFPYLNHALEMAVTLQISSRNQTPFLQLKLLDFKEV